MTSPAATSKPRPWSPFQWLCLLLAGALAAAGWMQAWKWRATAESQTKARTEARPDPARLKESSSGPQQNPTLELMGEVDLMRQVDLLTEENERLANELRKRDEADKLRNERAALDGSGGLLR